MDIITELNPNDVLAGRGASINAYPGNVQFRQLVARRKPEYRQLTRHQDKDVIARQIVSEIEGRGGRFLRRVKTKAATTSAPANDAEGAAATTTSLDRTIGDKWQLEDKSVVLEKVKQALREKPLTPDDRQAPVALPQAATGNQVVPPHLMGLYNHHQQQNQLQNQQHQPPLPLGSMLNDGSLLFQEQRNAFEMNRQTLLLRSSHVPQPHYASFDAPAAARAFLQRHPLPTPPLALATISGGGGRNHLTDRQLLQLSDSQPQSPFVALDPRLSVALLQPPISTLSATTTTAYNQLILESLRQRQQVQRQEQLNLLEMIGPAPPSQPPPTQADDATLNALLRPNPHLGSTVAAAAAPNMSDASRNDALLSSLHELRRSRTNDQHLRRLDQPPPPPL